MQLKQREVKNMNYKPTEQKENDNLENINFDEEQAQNHITSKISERGLKGGQATRKRRKFIDDKHVIDSNPAFRKKTKHIRKVT